MKLRGLVFFFVSVLLFCGSASAGWEPTFVDNFEGGSLKQDYWAYGRPNLSRRTHYYSSDAVKVKNGALEISAINQPEADRPYLSGAITTQGLFSQKHGYFEIRAKIPKGDGYWPAFWMMPVSGRWTSEIDAAEFFGDKPGSVWYAFHHSSKLHNENSYLAPTFQDLSQDFNTYAVEWAPDKIDYLFNGTVMHSVTDSAAIAKADSEMYLILNLALASQHTGFVTNINKDTDFTKPYIVDYVRAYKNDPSGRYASIPSPSASVPDKRPNKIDNTAVSVERIKGANEKDIMRSPDRIKGTIKLTSHAASVANNVVITLFKLENFIRHDGRYYNSAPIQSILEKNITFDNVGDTRQISYEFDPVINTVGAYAVDVLIKDPVSGNKKLLDGHRIVQYVDTAIPESTMFFDGFVEAVDTAYLNNKVSISAQIQLQQALLVPYLDVKFTIVDNYTSAIVKTKTVRHLPDFVGRFALDANIDVVLDIDGAYTLRVDVADSSGVEKLKQYSQHITGTNGPVTPPITVEPLKNWVPTFVDNFNGNSVKLENWGVGRENLSRRLSYYDKDALEVKNGILNIKILNNKPESDRPYLTSAITTQGLFKQKQGYFEMRAKMPKGDGFWPAFWLLPESGKWDSEIDISEFLGNKPDTIHYAYHYGGRLRNENSKQVSTLQNLSSAYNTYAVDWSPERIHYLFNGKIMHTLEGAELIKNTNSEMYLILNLALASQHTQFISNVGEKTDLSSSYSIDYVRVYKEVASGGFLGVPDHTVDIPDISGQAYDSTAISVDRVRGANESDIMRTAGKIKGGVRLTSHSASANAKVLITLFKLENFNFSNGRYFPSAPIQTISKNVSLTRVGETLDIPYEFDQQINIVGAYMVDVLIKDNASGNKKILTGHRIVQYVDMSLPDTTVFFDGFVRKGNASYSNGVISSSIDLQMQQALLTPYIDVRYSVINDATGSVIKTNVKRLQHQFVGLMSINRDITLNLDANKSYSLRVEVLDSSRTHSLKAFTMPITGTNGSKPPPPPTGTYELHGVSATVSGGQLNLRMDTTLPDGSTFTGLKYIVKLFSLQDNSLVSKVIGEQNTGYSNGRQTVTGSHVAPAGMANENYRTVVIMFKNSWEDSDKIIYETVESTP